MKPVFADTSFWIALFNRRDALHSKAVHVADLLRHTKIITSEWVLAEFLDGAADAGKLFRINAGDYVGRLRSQANLQILPISSTDFWAAHELFMLNRDKDWSLTDCTSFLAMKKSKILDALTHDRHFVQAGFRALLR